MFIIHVGDVHERIFYITFEFFLVGSVVRRKAFRLNGKLADYGSFAFVCWIKCFHVTFLKNP